MTVVWDGVREGFFMFWETLWALVLGFALSGAVQSFVSRAEMQRTMGDHRPRTVVRTSLLGAASSSCSYAASALAKSLFQRGADFTTAMVFMFASTNLVVELGLVLWVLLGWQFALAEFVGGTIMIVLFALLAPKVFPAAEIQRARTRLASVDGAAGSAEETDERALPLRQRLRQPSGWADAAGYAIADLTMLRREIVVGYLVAGLIAVAVPARVFHAVFFPGHGALSELASAAAGPLIAFVSFVCSIGNVPLAAALYSGGISFGGAIAFVFADLLALPLVLIYARLYGRRLAVRLFFSFWAVMSTAGLLTDLAFRALGLDFPARRSQIAATHFAWNYTSALNLVALAVAGALYWASRHPGRRSDAGRSPYARDPVCGMQVERGQPGAVTGTGTGPGTVYFCSDRCKVRYDREPARYAPVG